MLGAKVRGELFDKRKFILFLLIITGFILGATLGSYLFLSFQFWALAVPATTSLLLAFAYKMYILRE